jgi:hypothetical protein
MNKFTIITIVKKILEKCNFGNIKNYVSFSEKLKVAKL